MAEFDVDTLLPKGYRPNLRAKSPDPRNASEKSRGSSYSFQGDQAIPRKMPYHMASQKPPPPSVEDENDALAKEAGSVISSVPSEEPPNRGDPDQYPILLPVEDQIYQHNPERRFLLVSNPSDGSSDVSDPEKTTGQHRRSTERSAEPDPEPDFYEANTCRKKVTPPSRDEKLNRKETRPEGEYRPSRPGDLPPIITDGGSEAPLHDTRRSKQSSRVDNRGEDYFSPRITSATSRAPRELAVTPEIIEHATNGRDRSYYRGASSPEAQTRNRSTHMNDQRNQNVANDRKYKEREPKSAHARSPTVQKRRTSELSKYSRRDSRESCESSRQLAGRLSSRSSRKAPSSTNSQSDRDSSTQRSSARAPTHQNDTFYSSEDEPVVRVDPHRRRKSSVPPGNAGYLTTPVEQRVSGRRKSRGQSPLPSPRLSQTSLSDPYSSSSSSRSSTFPRESRPARDQDRAGQPLSRASTSTGSFNETRNGIPVDAAVASISNSNLPFDHRNTPAHPPPRADSRMQPPTTSAPTPSQPSWPPPRFEPPPQSNTNINPPLSSYRRFSTEMHSGELPDIPHCPRAREEAGHMDWLTLPRCDNFNICPSCYSANFASTEFAHEFVLMPFRPRERPLACDFGASEYYRIAWLFTRKYGRRDLGLFHSLTKIAAQVKPCTGHREVSRIWYSIKDPTTKRLIEEFTVCPACAKTVEALLPSLTGLFVPLDSPAEPTRGICAMHHDLGHDRGRFLLYFDVLEGAADRAFQTKSAPNVQAIATRIRQLAVIPPCPEDRILYTARWHTMRAVPSMSVCPECFLMVVQPLLDGREDLTVAGDFHHGPGVKERATCTLYSDRMRSIFHRAVMRKDLAYLKAKVNERADKKRECETRLEALKRQSLRTPWTPTEQERILREWQRFE
ncbi:hypothetical protein F5B22DRAFT_642661 [Xylaria bambusicola]|uniref:uncharacterized protein n=1 Tax=Xylaria bambusicola TaxID=326684 RepID=UPI002007FD0B|nr:uncharacterized protein F5B22DRAFT_642661 [Xylaria bambusicola]KAI0525654.1 hypothetical protein F5B22DRAFT_642661 [Xylaria bambusicola]